MQEPEAGKDWRQEEKGMTEDEMVGWHHQLNGHEFEQTLGVGDGQGSLACCSPWGRKESDWVTEQQQSKTINEDGPTCTLPVIRLLDFKLRSSPNWEHTLEFIGNMWFWEPLRVPSWPRNRTHVSSIGRQFLHHCATWEALRGLLSN